MPPGLGKLFIIFGVLFILIGCVMLIAPHIPFLGRLPGDIDYKGENVRFYFPIVTCIVLSILLTILLNLFGGGR